MKDDNAYSGAHLLIAFLAGAAAGAVTTMLVAPQSGTETRDTLVGWAKDAQDKAARVPTTLRHAYDKAARSASDAFNRALRRETEKGPVEVEVES